MGLPIHYKLHLPGNATTASAESLVRTAPRRAAALVRRRGLKEIGPVHPADPENLWCCGSVWERRGEDAGKDYRQGAGQSSSPGSRGKVRQTIKELGGTMPEHLPTAENIKKLEAKARKVLKNRKP